MMRSHAWLVPMTGTLLLCSQALAGPAPRPERGPATIGQELRLPALRVAQWDTVQIVALRPRLLRLQRSSPPETRPDSVATVRRLAFSAMSRFSTYERPRFSRVIVGAGQAAGTAGALSGLGLVGGLWGEKTAGYLLGAGAVLGALWGGTQGADDPSISIGIDTSPVDRAPVGHYPFPGRND